MSKTSCRQSNFSRTEILSKSQRLIKMTVSFFTESCWGKLISWKNILSLFQIRFFFHDMWSTMAPFLIVNVSFIVCVLLWWSNVYLSTFQCHTETKFDPHLPFKISFFSTPGGICESISVGILHWRDCFSYRWWLRNWFGCGEGESKSWPRKSREIFPHAHNQRLLSLNALGRDI